MAIIYLRDVPDDLQREIRIEAIRSDTSIKDLMLEAIIKELACRAKGAHGIPVAGRSELHYCTDLCTHIENGALDAAEED